MSGNGHGNGGGNGGGDDADQGGDVLPFRPREEEGAPRHPRPRHAARPGTAAGEGAPADGQEAELAGAVAALAARGLNEEEIRARLELDDALDARTEQVLAAAFRRGQLLGRAQIKEAQFEAALHGRVTAQTQVLVRLGEPRGEEGGEMQDGELGPQDSPHDRAEP